MTENNLNFKNIFHQPLPAGVFGGLRLTSLTRARGIIAQIVNWQPTDTLVQRGGDLGTLLGSVLGVPVAQAWGAATAHLPPDLALNELRDYLWAENDEQQAKVVSEALRRLGQEPGPAQILPPRVRLMTMHGAKGLNARVVFIPGLEEEVLPGPRRQPYPGLVLEAARLLYVSISRARAACLLSYARRRSVYGRARAHHASRFTLSVNGQFVPKQGGVLGLSAMECAAIAQECLLL